MFKIQDDQGKIPNYEVLTTEKLGVWALIAVGLHTANVSTVQNADVCLRSKHKSNHESYLQSFVCKAAVLASNVCD